MTPDIATLLSSVDACMLRDQRRLARWAQALRGRPNMQPQLHRLAEEIRQSHTLRQHRAQRLPKPRFPGDLPVVHKRAEIAETIARNQVVILCGETGSGKTTQLPKICLELGRGVSGFIGHTQPRRIAARAVAARIASELDTPLGQAVGYKVRFADTVRPSCYVKLMTDGILLAETQHDRLLEQYDTLIIDEAHERSLNIDFLLGYLHQLLPRRPDLKLIITSATIDPARFSRHFGNAPIIEVSGRTYPVEVRYRPIAVEEEDEEDPNMIQAILDAVDELVTGRVRPAHADGDGELSRRGPAPPGDILIFLSGEREIRETAEALREHPPAARAEILPLYARLSADEQNRIFAPHGRRRIVLATNVAETSLTVPGIRYVIDPGFARISRYSARNKLQRLPIERISQASANQRKGRCGRIAEGICIRLYGEEDFLSRALFTEPEIQRTNLASVILQMAALNLGSPETFPFLDPPDGRMIRDGYQTLHELGAVAAAQPTADPTGVPPDGWTLTPLGRDLARLPIDPRIGRMLLAGVAEGCLPEVLIIASALSIQDPRERPLEAQAAADEAHAKFRDPASDFLSYLELWKWYHKHAAHLSTNQLRKLCRENFVSSIRMREWHDTHHQLGELLVELGLAPEHAAVPRRTGGGGARAHHRAAAETPLQAPPEPIHRALLTGLLANVGFRGEGYEYIGARGRRFSIFPGSALFKHKPDWLMAAEIVETTKIYARTIAPVRPAWIEKLAPHLVQYAYSELRWSAKHARVEADERVSLFGMVLVPQRTVHYGPINPPAAREIFLRYALIEGDYPTSAPFLQNNRRLVAQVRTMEAKLRRHDLLVETQARYDFYAARVPETINSGPRFERWRRDAEKANPRLLFMTLADLLRPGAEVPAAEDFPDMLAVGESVLPLTYRLAPGDPDDGLTLTVPLALLPQLRPEPFEWLVPGMLLEKVAALIKSLPTVQRRNFVPVPQFAQAAAAALRGAFSLGANARPALVPALAEELNRLTGVEIPREAWRPESLPDHLRMRFAVVNEQNVEVASGRDFIDLQQRLAPPAAGAFTRLEHPAFMRDNLTAWDFGELPERIELKRHGMTLFGYPALVETAPPPLLDPTPGAALPAPTVSLRLLDSPESAQLAHQAGMVRLLIQQLGTDLHHLAHNLPDKDRIYIHYALIGTPPELRHDMLRAIVARTFLPDRAHLRARAEFDGRRESRRGQLPAVAVEITALVRQILEIYHAITLDLERCYPVEWTQAIYHIQQQLQDLLPRGFVSQTPYEWLVHFPRYLQAVQIRMQKLGAGHVARDARHAAEIEAAWQTYVQRKEQHRLRNIHDPALEQYRWMVEEWRVSLFAQELATAVQVSARRLEKQLELVKP